ncbi:MAG: hypothetical protein Q7S24_00565, partial [bacterium]|nr:hypothetical protein [bacterium]
RLIYDDSFTWGDNELEQNRLVIHANDGNNNFNWNELSLVDKNQIFEHIKNWLNITPENS